MKKRKGHKGKSSWMCLPKGKLPCGPLLWWRYPGQHNTTAFSQEDEARHRNSSTCLRLAGRAHSGPFRRAVRQNQVRGRCLVCMVGCLSLLSLPPMQVACVPAMHPCLTPPSRLWVSPLQHRKPPSPSLKARMKSLEVKKKKKEKKRWTNRELVQMSGTQEAKGLLNKKACRLDCASLSPSNSPLLWLSSS